MADFPTDKVYPIKAMRAHVPHDVNKLALGPCRAVWVGVSGDISVQAEQDADPVVLPNAAAGMWHPVSAIRIRASGTTAQNIVVGY